MLFFLFHRQTCVYIGKDFKSPNPRRQNWAQVSTHSCLDCPRTQDQHRMGRDRFDGLPKGRQVSSSRGEEEKPRGTPSSAHGGEEHWAHLRTKPNKCSGHVRTSRRKRRVPRRRVLTSCMGNVLRWKNSAATHSISERICPSTCHTAPHRASPPEPVQGQMGWKLQFTKGKQGSFWLLTVLNMERTRNVKSQSSQLSWSQRKGLRE